MTTKTSTVAYRDFTGGMHDGDTIANIKSNEVSLMQNIEPLERGGYTQRKGCVKATSLTMGVISRLIYYKGTRYYVTKIPDGGGGYVGRISKWDNTGIGILTSADVSWVIFKDILYLLDGTKYYQYTEAGGLSIVSGKGGMNLDHIFRCKYVYKRGARLFFAGDPQNPNLMWFSGIGDATDIAFGSSVQAVTETNDKITGLFEFSKHMLAFQNRTLYGWSGWNPATDVQFDKLPVHRGSPNYRTIVDNNMAIYYGVDGIYGLLSTYDYQINSDMLSEGLMNTLKSVTHPDKAVAVLYQNKYLLALCTDNSGSNNIVVVGYTSMAKTVWPNKTTLPWSIITGWQVNDWFIDPDDNCLYFASNNSNIYKAFSGDSDDGIAIDARAVHSLDLGKMFHQKKIKSMVIAAKQYVEQSCIINVDIKVDYKEHSHVVDTDESLVYGEGFWGNTLWGWVDSVVKEIPIRIKGSFMEISISHKVVDQPMTLYGFAFYTKMKTRPKGVRLGVNNS